MTSAMMIRIHELPAVEWDRLAEQFEDLTFEQTGAYATAAARRIGARAKFFALEDSDGIVAAAAVRMKAVPVLRRGIAWIPSGPLLRPKAKPAPGQTRIAAVLSLLRQQVSLRDGYLLRFRPSGTSLIPASDMADAAREAGYVATAQRRAYRSFAMDLSLPEATLLRALHGKWRTDLRFAQKSGLELDRGHGASYAQRFLALFDQVQLAKGFQPDIDPAFHFALDGPTYDVEILLAQKNGQDIAGIVTGRSGVCTTYLFGATTEAGRPLRAGYFLTWAAMQLARTRGGLWYDMGGVDFEANPDVARFKDRMNGVPLLAEVFETRPPGLAGLMVAGLETLHAQLKRR